MNGASKPAHNNMEYDMDNTTSTIDRLVKVTLKSKESYVIPVTMRFDDCPHDDLIGWASQSRVIDMQRMLRTLAPETLGEMVTDGLDVHASTCTVKPVSFTETKAQIRALASTMTKDEKDAMIAALMA